MKFGEFDIAGAAGAVLAHTVHLPGGLLKKGRVLTSEDIAALTAAGIVKVMAARLDDGDEPEDEAARRIAARSSGNGVAAAPAFTGRANLIATENGIALVAQEVLIRLNALDEGLTLATVPPFTVVQKGQLVATIKIIPFALPGAVVAAAEALLDEAPALVGVARFEPHRAGLILTRVDGMKPGLIDKRIKVMRERLEALGSTLAAHETVAHETAAVTAAISRQAEAGLDPILVFGASAIVDRGDVVPAAVGGAGGRVVHLGMPVDPGNLLMLGRVGSADVIGVPSCATSPKLNGFDWVLARLMAGSPVGRAEIVSMAPGGLLTEIAARPQPRLVPPRD